VHDGENRQQDGDFMWEFPTAHTLIIRVLGPSSEWDDFPYLITSLLLFNYQSLDVALYPMSAHLIDHISGSYYLTSTKLCQTRLL
jgi:hypothetical protein